MAGATTSHNGAGWCSSSIIGIIGVITAQKHAATTTTTTIGAAASATAKAHAASAPTGLTRALGVMSAVVLLMLLLHRVMPVASGLSKATASACDLHCWRRLGGATVGNCHWPHSFFHHLLQLLLLLMVVMMMLLQGMQGMRCRLAIVLQCCCCCSCCCVCCQGHVLRC